MLIAQICIGSQNYKKKKKTKKKKKIEKKSLIYPNGCKITKLHICFAKTLLFTLGINIACLINLLFKDVNEQSLHKRLTHFSTG